MNILSCFDGISCGRLALDRAGIKVDKYFASEIDPYAIKIASKNYPDTIQLGDIENWQDWNLPPIDMVIGGSPCQGFSQSGRGMNFGDPRSQLFFTFTRIVEVFKPKYFLLENVKMRKKEWQDIISFYMGVEPILINSALVSAQNRERLYWTNIPGVVQPEDRHIYLKDILESDVADKYYVKCDHAGFKRTPDQKSKTLTGGHSGNNHSQCTLLQIQADSVYSNNTQVRKLTPVECERLQTVPDGYTEGISNTQRYKTLGNGWTVDVIAHIFSFIR